MSCHVVGGCACERPYVGGRACVCACRVILFVADVQVSCDFILPLASVRVRVRVCVRECLHVCASECE